MGTWAHIIGHSNRFFRSHFVSSVTSGQMDSELQALVATALKSCLADTVGTTDIAEVDARDLECMPHQGAVFCDPGPHGSTVITNIITHERLLLPASSCPSWTMEFDSDGFAAAVPEVDDETIEPILLEDVLKYQTKIDCKGNKFIVHVDPGGTTHTLSIANFETKFTEVTLHLKIGATAQDHTFVAVMLKWPRHPGARVMFSCKSLYHSLGFNQFDGQWWRWVWAGLPRWKSYLSGLGLQLHVLRSVQTEVDDESAGVYFDVWVNFIEPRRKDNLCLNTTYPKLPFVTPSLSS
jgi:hypothetical protein